MAFLRGDGPNAGHQAEFLQCVLYDKTASPFCPVAEKVGKGRRCPRVPPVNVSHAAAPEMDIAVRPVP